MKKFLLTLSWVMMAAVAMAVPAKRGVWKTLKMADGTEVRAQLMGDEHVHFWLTEDGHRLVKSGNAFELVGEQALQQRVAARRIARQQARAKAPRRVSMGDRTNYLGKKKGIVILAQYKDVKFNTANNLAKYKRILNEEGYTTSEGFKGSVADYFKAQSAGKFELDFDVVGPYTLKYNRDHYGANDDYDEDQAADEMIVEACQQANASVNFADYDWDGDGYVDQVFVLYAGTGEADSYDDEAIWPHMYELSATNKTLKLDGVTIDTYACSNEVDMSGNIEGIGCFCHEFSHCMGFPDFYDIMYNGSFGLSQFDLMDQGSYNGNAFVPAGYSGHEKMMCGWQEPIELSDEDVTVENLKALSEGGESYIIYNKAHPDEYYMLENRQKKGWDAGLPDNGLMITHVDFDKTIWQYNIPNSILTNSEARQYGMASGNDHQRCTIFHADNDDDSKYWTYYPSYDAYDYSKTTLTTDLYPYSSNNSLTNKSKPAATLYNANTDGSKYMNRRVLAITQNSDGTVSFQYKATAKDENEEDPFENALFYESFDACDGKGGNDGSWSGQVANGSFSVDNEGWTSEKAYGADQCAKFGTSSVAGEATTPSIALNGEATLTFKAGAWNAKNDGEVLNVTVTGGTIEPSSFTMKKGDWTDFEAKVTGTGNMKVTFKSAKGRFFLDEVMIVKADGNAIEAVTADAAKEARGEIYDLSGRRVKNPTRGIYIMGGKKFIKR